MIEAQGRRPSGVRFYATDTILIPAFMQRSSGELSIFARNPASLSCWFFLPSNHRKLVKLVIEAAELGLR